MKRFLTWLLYTEVTFEEDSVMGLSSIYLYTYFRNKDAMLI